MRKAWQQSKLKQRKREERSLRSLLLASDWSQEAARIKEAITVILKARIIQVCI